LSVRYVHQRCLLVADVPRRVLRVVHTVQSDAGLPVLYDDRRSRRVRMQHGLRRDPAVHGDVAVPDRLHLRVQHVLWRRRCLPEDLSGGRVRRLARHNTALRRFFDGVVAAVAAEGWRGRRQGALSAFG
jgi:hypothetical protein